VRNGTTRRPAISRSATIRVQAISSEESWTCTGGSAAIWRECVGTSPGSCSSSGTISSPSIRHIFPGCSRTGRTARTESAPGTALSRSHARRIVAPRRNGLVGRRIENASKSSRRASSCSTQSMSEAVEVAIAAGRRPGTSAPWRRATAAISSLSVDTTIASNRPLSRAAAIECASSGWPASGRMFLPGTRTEPARAGTRATTRAAMATPAADRG